MSESTPLLPGSSNRNKEHNIFLRFCHSPWSFIDQNALLLSRSVLLGYTSAVWITKLVVDIENGNGSLFAFDIGHISLLMQMIYYAVTTVSDSSTSLEPYIDIYSVDVDRSAS